MQSFLQCLAMAVLLATAGCGTAAPPPARPALAALLREKKFEPHGYYTGPDTPEDQQPLREAVDRAIRDVSALPEPLNKDAVRHRLSTLIGDTDLYATEDRDEVGRYAIRIWRAAGYQEESRIFPVGDERVLANP
jgi:hypothetical protein